MKLDEIVAWYQKRIGTYDKQEWEKTVEQKILDGFSSSVTLKNAKLKTELIDVDLVRGSTFPKAKPKQTLLTVIRLAILRYLLLPIYAQWWVRQTSPKTFVLLLFLYITQMLNWAIYTFNVNRLITGNDILLEQISQTTTSTRYYDATDAREQTEEHIVSVSELLIPMTLSLLISLIHSQIVATNSASSVNKKKRRRFSNASFTGKNVREIRLRRRKKLVSRIRPSETSEIGLISNTAMLQKRTAINIKPATPINSSTVKVTTSNSCTSVPSEEVFATTTAITLLHKTNPSIEFGTADAAICQKPTLNVLNVTSMDSATLKKRNVNWHSSLHNYEAEALKKQQQTLSQTQNTAIQSSSFSSSSSSAQVINSDNETTSPTLNETKNAIKREVITEPQLLMVPPNSQRTSGAHRNIGEDDGFESLNGKSSSGEDTHSPLLANNVNPLTSNLMTIPSNNNVDNAMGNQLRLRLNVNACEKKTKMPHKLASTSSDVTDEEGDDGDLISSPASACQNECTTSATEWLGITTNSEDCCSYSSELEHTDNYKNHRSLTDDDVCELDFMPATILNPHSSTERISCTIWEQREIKKAQMSVLEISSCIIDRVDSMQEANDYIYIGLCFSFLLSLIPTFCRLCEVTIDADKTNEISYFELPKLLWQKASFSFYTIFRFAFGYTYWERTVLLIAFVQRLCLTLILFFIFAVAERTFKQRFLYAKLFSHLTSSRRARKSNLPHFRLNKVRNIKTWLSVRSYLKKRGPQRSVDIIVSAAFIVTLLLLAFLSVEWLKDSVHLHSHLNFEALMWSITIGIFLLRFMTLGNKIQHKYRSVSVLITEQINLYLQIEQKPKKKDELMVSNSVLKLAGDLLKELESPFKISGLSANPYLFTTIKVVVLSALSGVLSEVLGFKLKLHKIKIK